MPMLLTTDFSSLIQSLISVSPAARLCHDSEGYLLNIEEDDATPEMIAEILILRLIDDLNNIGVHMQGTVSDFSNGWEGIQDFVSLCGMLLPAGLTNALSHDLELRAAIRGILDGHSGIEEDPLLALLMLYAELPTYARQYGDMAIHLQEYVESSPAFGNYLHDLIEESAKVTLKDDVISDATIQFIEEVTFWRSRFIGMVAKVVNQDVITSTVGDKLEACMDAHLRDITSPSRIDRFALWWSLKQKALDGGLIPVEIELLDRITRELTASSKLYAQSLKFAKVPEAIGDELGDGDNVGMVLWAMAVTPTLTVVDAIRQMTAALTEATQVCALSDQQIADLTALFHSEG